MDKIGPCGKKHEQFPKNLIPEETNVFERIKKLWQVNLDATCAVLIDMQGDWVKNLSAIETRKVIAEQIAIIEACAKRGIPILAVEGWPDQFGKTVEVLADTLEKAKAGTAVEYFQKYRDDAFSNKDFGKAIERHGAKKLILMGLNADYCVKATAESALERGLSILASKRGVIQANGQRPYMKWYRENGMLRDSLVSVLTQPL